MIRSRRRRFRFLAWQSVAWLSGLFAVVLGGPALADPALWVVEGPHAKAYLFGTIHILRPGQHWRTPALDRAFADSQTLLLEIPDADDAAAMQAGVRTFGLDPAHPLSGKIAPADLARLDAAAKALGSPKGEAMLEPMRPWLAAVALTTLPMIKAGYAPDSGVEKVLMRDAKTAGKPIQGFETLNEQLRFFADLPSDQEVALLVSTLDEIGDTPAKLDEMVDAWVSGDVAKVGDMLDEHMKADSPKLYDTLLTQRNLNWAAQLDGRLRGQGVTFVAVGAGHLAGPDSLLGDLEARGYKVRRIQ